MWISLISFLFKNWKIVLASVVCLSAGFVIAWKLQGLRYDNLMNTYNKCQHTLNACIDANKENQNTIVSLKKELEQSKTTCEKRITYYKKLIKDFQNIDNLIGGNGGQNSTNKCPDDVCNMLNGMFK